MTTFNSLRAPAMPTGLSAGVAPSPTHVGGGHASVPAVAAVAAAFARCEAALTAHGAEQALGWLVEDLATVRAGVAPATWRAAVEATRDHPLHARLAADPYTAQARAKPRGYAGDAHTLDFVYGYREADAGTSAEGQRLFAVTTGVPIARAVRARCAHVAAVLEDTVRHAPNAVVLSIACGHMRELHAVPPALLGRATLLGLDQDTRSLAVLSALHPGQPLTPISGAIRGVLIGRVALPQADLIYASGLYDYLDRQVAVALTSALARSLRPGGTLLIPNITPANAEIAYMEAVMDWWMVYRDPAEMTSLGRDATEELAARGAADCAAGRRKADDTATTAAWMARTYTVAEERIACLAITQARAEADVGGVRLASGVSYGQESVR